MTQEINVSTPESLAQSGSVAEAPLATSDATVSNVAAAARQFAEVKGAIQLAREYPRNEADAFKSMRRTCERSWFADNALYGFPRGKKPDGSPNIVSGASIRLIEELVRAYRNIEYGFRIMEMRDDRSLVEAFAYDVENNTRVRREFWVLHVRETKAGNFPISSPRDIYELCANMSQRRVRSCVEQMLPVDLLEEAKSICKKTMARGGDGIPFKDRVRNMVVEFGEYGISQDMIEEFLGHTIDVMIIEEMPKLKQIFRSIKDKAASREDFFNVPEAGFVPEPIPKKKSKEDTKPVPADEHDSKAKPISKKEADRKALEEMKKNTEAKRAKMDSEGTSDPNPPPKPKKPPVEEEKVDPETGEVLTGNTMTVEEMEQIKAEEQAEYEAGKKKNGTGEEEEENETLPFADEPPAAGSTRRPRARKVKKNN